ncbi:endonuclease [Aeromonas phage CC2]|uniref:CapR homology domain-containing protein n=1 Tax=Aeromonas phage CC2 TaxID=1204516 RepID=I6WMH4_9CAUD|nr:endonuclease [Aeromonas phage CC2]AFN39413.1 hypothetical protein CC2_293 [Aeromonas phage CC2]QAX99065.1 hypothetical protein assk_277 [Aeromonas phage Assk]
MICDFVGSNFTTDRGGKIVVINKIKKLGRTHFEYTCSICSEDKELYPHPFSTTKYNLENGNFNCGCSKKKHLTKEQHEILIKRRCEKSGYKFIEFSDYELNDMRSVVFECKHHGTQKSFYVNFVNKETGCPSCSKNKRKTLKEISSHIKSLCDDSGYEFLGFPEGYKNQKSRFEYICPDHGINSSTANNFINGYRCSGCSSHGGYDKSKSGWFYVYKYKAERLPVIYKYGITNRDPDERSSEHIRGVDMEISENVFKRLYDDGNVPFNIEQKIKQQFSGVSDWLYSGNTETIYERDLPRVLSIIQEV